MTNEEIFDVTDADDCVVDQMPRSKVHALGLMHRAVHVFVFNKQGELLLQKRSATKDEFPLCFTSSASGHVSAGETYDECAPRELAEEVGLRAPLERLKKFAASPELANEHTVLYRAVTDDRPNADPEEVNSVIYMTLDEIVYAILNYPQQFAPPFCTLFDWYYKFQSGERGA